MRYFLLLLPLLLIACDNEEQVHSNSTSTNSPILAQKPKTSIIIETTNPTFPSWLIEKLTQELEKDNFSIKNIKEYPNVSFYIRASNTEIQIKAEHIKNYYVKSKKPITFSGSLKTYYPDFIITEIRFASSDVASNIYRLFTTNSAYMNSPKNNRKITELAFNHDAIFVLSTDNNMFQDYIYHYGYRLTHYQRDDGRILD